MNLIRKGVVVVLVWLLLASAVEADGGLTAELAQIETSKYPEITLYVSVRDETGNIVGGLEEQMFEITEDGVAVDIIAFSAGTRSAISTVLTVDRSSSMLAENKLIGAKSAAKTFVDLMREQDQVALVAFDNVVQTVQPFTSDKVALKQKIDSLRTGDCTAWYDGVYHSVDIIASLEGRRSIILLSDGIDCREDFWYQLFGNGSAETLESAIQHAQRAGIPVYSIGFGQTATQEVSNEGFDERKLRQMAEQTGGEYFYAPNASELEALYEGLSFEMQNEYVLTYRSPRPTYDGTRRDIAVTIGQGSEASVTTQGRYLEQHLVNIRSDPALFLLFLAPLLFLLGMPAMASKVSRLRAGGGIKQTKPEPQVAPVPPQQPPSASSGYSLRPKPVSHLGSTSASGGKSEGATGRNGLTDKGPFRPPARPPSVPPNFGGEAARPLAHGGSGLPRARLVARFPMLAEGVSIGRALSNHIVLKQPSVAPQHARIARQGKRYVIDDLGSGQTFVSFNGDPAKERPIRQNALKDGSSVRFGAVRCTVRLSAPMATGYLEVPFPIQKTVMTIGRETSNDIYLNAPGVPQRAEIRYEAGHFVVYGGSTGETLLVSFSGDPRQERQVQGRNALKAGSTLRVGHVVLVLEMAS